MSSPGSTTIVTQLVVNALGAKSGVADFEAAMERAKAAANGAGVAGNTFDASLKKWTQSLASTDPVLRAQIQQQQALQRQMAINTQAVRLGITTGAAAEQQLERVRLKYQGYVTAAEQAAVAQTSFGKATSFVTAQMGPLLGLFAVGSIVAFGKGVFDTAAALNEQAEQVGVSTDALQTYRAVLLENGIAADQTDQILTRLTRSIGSAQATSGPARDAFNQLGISLDTLKGGAEQTLPAVASALLKIADPAQRAALEVDLFSRSGQKLESTLHALVDPTSTLIEKQKALGQVMGHDLTIAADDAADHLTAAWNRVKIGSAPGITWMVEQLARVVEFSGKVNDVAHNLGWGSGPQKAAAAANDSATPYKPPSQVYDAHSLDSSYSQVALDQYIAKQKLSASIAGQGPVQQAQTNALIEAANVKLASGAGLSSVQLDHFKNQDGTMRKFVTSTAEAVDVLGKGTAQEVQGLAATIQRGAAWNKLKDTFDTYLDSLREESRLAGESAGQRQIDNDTIKAAQVLQKQMGGEAKDQAKTLAEATGYLQQQGELHHQNYLGQVQDTAAATLATGVQKEITDQLKLADVALASGRDERQLALEIAQKQLDLGRQLTDVEKDGLRLKQQKNDATGLKDYLSDLRDEASLAGLSADEREREEAVLRAVHQDHIDIHGAQAAEINGIIQARQETERWRQVVDGITDGFQGFFEDVLNTGKLSFGSLWDTIKQQFNKMLAYMAAQALVAPIIIPMVQEFGLGGSGASTILGGSGGGGALGILSAGGSLASGASSLGLFGSGGIGGLFGTSAGAPGGIFNSIGGALGFSSQQAVGLNEVGGLSFAQTPGSLFGTTTLGGLLGGAGIGSLASSLVFGNKADASMGGMGGALAGAALGSIIPGIGTIIGGLVGGLAGGGLGSMTGSSNNGAIANFSNGGASNYLFKAGSDANGSSSTQAASTISDAIKTLQGAGVNIGLGNITGLSIGSDKSYVYDSAGGKQKLAGGDVEGVVNAVLTRILPTISGSTPEAQALIAKYQGNGGINAGNLSQFETDLGSAKNFADALANLKDSGTQLSQVGQQLKAINDQYTSLVTQAQQLGLATDTLTQARDQAVQDITDNFNDSVTDALQSITDGPLQQWNALITQQNAQIADGKAASADMGQLEQLQVLQRKALLMSLDDAQRESLENLIGMADDLATKTVNLQAEALKGVSDQSSAISKLIDDQSDLSKQYGQVSAALNTARTGFLVDPNLNRLSPTDAYAQSRQQLEAAASSGSLDDLDKLSSLSQAFLQNSLAVNATSSPYAQDFQHVQDLLTAAQHKADAQQAATLNVSQIAQQELDQLTLITTELQKPNPDTAVLTTMLGSINTLNNSLISLGVGVDTLGNGVDVTNLGLVSTPINQLVSLTAATASTPSVVVVNSASNDGSVSGTSAAVAEAVQQAVSSSVSMLPGWMIDPSHGFDLNLYPVPGHATGLDRVPYDNYLMRAHEGEAVLTKTEAAQWRGGRGQGTNDNSALIQEVRALRAELQAIRAATAATAGNTADAVETAKATADGVSRMGRSLQDQHTYQRTATK